MASRLIFQREQLGFEWLAQVSVAHLYCLCQSETHAISRRQLHKTRLACNPIGQRRAPKPNGQSGYLRIDTVHQGDHNKSKGVYYINAVEQETQYEVVTAVAQLREEQVHPALQHLMEQFPFRIRGVRTDNGTEYVNHIVGTGCSNTALIVTRSRLSNDNGLVESKNAAVVRKWFGHAHIQQSCTERINQFTEDLNPYLNFRCSCLSSRVRADQRGKEKRVYRTVGGGHVA